MFNEKNKKKWKKLQFRTENTNDICIVFWNASIQVEILFISDTSEQTVSPLFYKKDFNNIPK